MQGWSFRLIVRVQAFCWIGGGGGVNVEAVIIRRGFSAPL